MSSIRAVAAFLVICLASGFVSAQDRSSKDKDKNSKDRPVEIRVNVTVTDASGKVPADAKMEDLRIFEDEVEQKITYFSGKEPILNLGVVIDNTGSMRMHLNSLVRSGAALVSILRPTDEAFVVRFVNSDNIRIVQDWTSNKSHLNTAFGQMYVEGGQSAVIDALYLSAQKLLEREKKNASKRYALVLITDAEDRDSFYKLAELRSLLEKSDVQIFVVALTKDLADTSADAAKPKGPKAAAENLARALALESGGAAYVLGETYDDRNLVAALNSIIGELSSRYIVGYTSTNQKRDGLPRKLRVEISKNEKGETRRAAVRESFVVPKN